MAAYAAATIGSVVVVLVGAVAWLLGQARYTDDYCFTRAPVPDGPGEGPSGRGPFYDSPIHLRCDWDGVPDVVVTDPAPLLLAAAVAGVALLVVTVLWRSARRIAQSSSEPVPSSDR